MANFTEKMIIESFLRLLESRSFDKITVKDIIEETGISRNTFYYHYDDIFDLVKDILDQEFDRLYNADFSEQNWKIILKEATIEATKSKKQLYHIVNSLDRKTLEHYLYKVAQKILDLYIKENIGEIDQNEYTYFVLDCYKCAIVGVTMKWIDEGMIDHVETVNEAVSLFTGSIESIINKIQDLDI